MLKYEKIKPKVYIETTVVRYLVARPSTEAILGTRQQVTQQLWENYSDNFEFIVSDIVIAEIRQGDEMAAQRRIDAVTGLTVLDMSPQASALALELVNTGTVPPHSLPDAQHIAIAVVNNTISKCLSDITGFDVMSGDAEQTGSLFYIKRDLLAEMV